MFDENQLYFYRRSGAQGAGSIFDARALAPRRPRTGVHQGWMARRLSWLGPE